MYYCAVCNNTKYNMFSVQHNAHAATGVCSDGEWASALHGNVSTIRENNARRWLCALYHTRGDEIRWYTYYYNA